MTDGSNSLLAMDGMFGCVVNKFMEIVRPLGSIRLSDLICTVLGQ